VSTGVLRLALIGTGLLGMVAVVRLAAWPLVRVTLPAVSDSVSTTRVADAKQVIAADSVAAIVSRDPFRIGHRPALPAYDPLRLAEQLAPPPPRPALVLVGVTDGAMPSAVVEGLPGVEGARVVRIGDVIGGLAIKKMSGGQVVISGMDTTWVLEVRKPWKN
jgi:hypothetical protein